MGGTPSRPVKQWADSPFKLIESPRHKRGNVDISKESHTFVFANEMVLVHNTLIRALNCIYLQAPNVKDSADVVDFLTYMKGWSRFLHMHHEAEEEVCFPVLEKMIGLPGFLDKNVEQHQEFGPGMLEFDGYVKACQEGKESFSAAKIRRIIDGFGEIRTTHLTGEIDVLLTLEEHNHKIDWVGFNKMVQKKAVDEGDPQLEIPCVITNLDVTTEGGIHSAVWPPMPWHVMQIFRWWYIPKHRGAWRFSSCDERGYPKELQFV